MLEGITELIGVVNPKRKRGRPKKKRSRKTRTVTKYKTRYRMRANPKRKRSRARPKRRATRRTTRRAPTVIINPIGRDIMQDIKNGAIIAAGMLGATVVVAYAREKVELIAANVWAPGAVMIATGITVPMALKGKNRKLGTLIGLGSIGLGLYTLITPYIAGKLPGFPAMATMAPAPPLEGYYKTGRGRLGAYVPRSTLGQVDPNVSMNKYAFSGLGNGLYN